VAEGASAEVGSPAAAACSPPAASNPAPIARPPAAATPAPRARPAPWLFPALAGLGVVVVLGAAVLVSGMLHFGPARPASTSAAFPHGKLIYQAKAVSDTWSAGSPPTPDPPGSAGVSYSGTSIDLDILKPGGNLEGQLEAPALKDFALELVISAAAGSDREINWWLRGTSDAALDLHFDLASETVALDFSPNVGDPEVLVKDIRLTGLQSGRRMTLGVVADGSNVSIYLDGKRVAAVVETRADGGTTPGFFMDGQSGSFHLDSVRYYAVG
jgi:hypothetical protein